MTREEVFDKLTEVFRTVFDDDSITLSDSTTSADIEDWDSLEHIDLIVSVEKSLRHEIQYVRDHRNEECR